jgi:hypothetical protein
VPGASVVNLVSMSDVLRSGRLIHNADSRCYRGYSLSTQACKGTAMRGRSLRNSRARPLVVADLPPVDVRSTTVRPPDLRGLFPRPLAILTFPGAWFFWK